MTHSVDSIKTLLNTNDEAVKRAILALFARQTATEQYHEGTEEHNARGFNSFDAPILSSFAHQLQSKGWLSAKQIACARKKLGKYARQLLEISNERAAGEIAAVVGESMSAEAARGLRDYEHAGLDILKEYDDYTIQFAADDVQEAYWNAAFQKQEVELEEIAARMSMR